jgi:hypothetical protein
LDKGQRSIRYRQRFRVRDRSPDRWSFKPELGISRPFGPYQKWVVDGYVSAYFFTDNTQYHGTEILRQEALPGFEAHLSYNITPNLWASLDAYYAFRGNTVVDGVDQNNAQKNLTVGTETNWTINSRNAIGVLFAKSIVHENAPSLTEVALKYFYSWGSGY